ncbi:MAG: adenine phosphoribosyltransferase [Peptoniphilaceae bacterium]|nr:adenine phosphoribosyltransferase [Peptoniphilaceae bacterium]MDD7382792.1 adenine phosphoribosyltransferase [Peptoniphilaceae bacterium]MDY3737950.1 adenine phosphoribosyltransferase [Peptoniphilaceae bacterium]
MDIISNIRVIEDFPIKGISYKDISTLIGNKDAFKFTIDELERKLQEKNIEIDKIAGIESRGFIFGAALAYKMDKSFLMIRKPGKLPADTVSVEYELEYGTDKLEIHRDSVKKNDKVLIIDDLLATGGTTLAAAKLIEKLEGEVCAIESVVELKDLDAREKLKKYEVISLVKYDH